MKKSTNKVTIYSDLSWKILGGIALFLVLSLINIKSSIPENVKLSAPVGNFLIFYGVIAFFSSLYLLIILIKNKAWLTRAHLVKLLALCFTYGIFHLFISVTPELNNPDFKLDYSFIQDHFLSDSYSILLFILLGLSLFALLFWKINQRRQEKGKGFSRKERRFLPFRGQGLLLKDSTFYIIGLTILAFLDQFTQTMVWNIGFGPYNSNGVFRLLHNEKDNVILGHEDFLRLLGDYFVLFLLILGISALLVKGFGQLMRHQTGFSLAFLSSLFLAFVFNYLIQSGMKQSVSVAYQGNMVTGATAFQVLILTLIFLLLYLLINRFMASTFLILVVFGGFAVANQMKFSLRDEPVYFSDLTWLKNPGILISFVDIKMVLLLLLALAVLVSLAVFLGRKFYRGKIVHWKLRLAGLVGLLVIFLPIAQNFVHFNDVEARVKLPIMTNYLDEANGDVLWKGGPFTASAKSLSYVWMRQAFGAAMDQPKGYSEDAIKKIEQRYSELAQSINQNRSENIGDQTVIYILSESLANPSRVPGVTLSGNPLAQIDAIKGANTGGIMYSNGYGGGTANMEAQSLSGLPMSNYSSNVSVINSDVFPRMPFIPSISDAFTDKIALHPENATNYNRNIVYTKLGFDHFYATSGTSAQDTLTDQQTLDGKVSDAQTYQDILSKIDPNKSQFFSVLTMQNHMPYTAYTGGSTLSATGEGYSDATNQLLQNYTRKLQETDFATQQFLDELQKIDKKITVVFYGDHLPSLYPTPSETFASNPLLQYETDYFIWTNQGNNENLQENLNSAEFTPAMLQVTGAKVSPYYALLSEVMWKLPAQYDTPLGASVKLDKAQEEVLDDLKMVQYDLVSGKHYLKADSSFFKMK